MAESSTRNGIVIAVIGLAGTLGTAVIANWDKLTGDGQAANRPVVREADKSAASTIPAANSVARDTPDVITVAGTWHDTNFPANGSSITQTGSRIEFNGWGSTPQGVPFRNSGTGTIDGRTVTSTYATNYTGGVSSRGPCSGTVTPDGRRMTSTCTDSILGTFVMSGIRD